MCPASLPPAAPALPPAGALLWPPAMPTMAAMRPPKPSSALDVACSMPGCCLLGEDPWEGALDTACAAVPSASRGCCRPAENGREKALGWAWAAGRGGLAGCCLLGEEPRETALDTACAAALSRLSLGCCLPGEDALEEALTGKACLSGDDARDSPGKRRLFFAVMGDGHCLAASRTILPWGEICATKEEHEHVMNL